MPSAERQNNNPQDLKRELERVLKYPMDRRVLLGSLTLLTFGSSSTVGMLNLVSSMGESYRKARKITEQTYPEVSNEVLKEANDQIANLKSVTDQLAAEGKLSEIASYVDEEKLKEAYETKNYIAQRDKFFEEVYKNDPNKNKEWIKLAAGLGLTIPAAFGLFFGSIGLGYEIHYPRSTKRRFTNSILILRPEWLRKTPTKDEVTSLARSISCLPPVGGKIDEASKPNLKIIEPSLTAEEHVLRVIDWTKNRKEGEGYIHQLTVQGRLPDEFKYSAIALILSSPYVNDWQKPIYGTEWAKVAPLIHDGGNVEVISPLWNKLKGRTDFLQRLSTVHHPSSSNMQDVWGRWADEIRAIEEQKRLELECKFYQRSALALHAKLGNTPSQLSEESRGKLAEIWDSSKSNLEIILQEYEIQNVVSVPWFADKPRNLWSNQGPRYEANWPPIQQELIHLEEVRHEYPELQDRVHKLMADTVQSVDQTIGLGR